MCDIIFNRDRIVRMFFLCIASGKDLTSLQEKGSAEPVNRADKNVCEIYHFLTKFMTQPWSGPGGKEGGENWYHLGM